MGEENRPLEELAKALYDKLQVEVVSKMRQEQEQTKSLLTRMCRAVVEMASEAPYKPKFVEYRQEAAAYLENEKKAQIGQED
jgi:hypothetical protein